MFAVGPARRPSRAHYVILSSLLFASLIVFAVPPAQPTSAAFLSADHPLTDFHEYYWANGERIPLQRRADQLAIKFTQTGHTALTSLQAPGGPLARFSHVAAAGPALDIFQTAPGVQLQSSQDALRRLGSAAGLAWVAPVFQVAGSNAWLIATNELIVALRAGVSPQSLFAGDGRFTSYRPLLGTPDQFVATVAAGGGTPTLALANALQNDPRVRWASPNFMRDVRPANTTNDPLLADQWHLKNTGQYGGSPGADARVLDAWNIITDTSKIVIAIVDDGVQLDHPDLAANIFDNPGEIPNNGVDDDSNGWIDDVHGWDFAQDDNNPGPSDAQSNHGTAVAGVAAAVGGNGIGVAGAAFRAHILPVRMANRGIYAGDAATAAAFYYAAGLTADGRGKWRGADIINFSWGGGAPSSVLSDALSWATTQGRGGKGAVVTNSAGNDRLSFVVYPASNAGVLPGLIAVGASTDTDTRADYSNYGSDLTLVAPSGGGNARIATTDRTGADGYGAGDYVTGISGFSGTSSAAPLTAGVAALLLAKNSALTSSQVRSILQHSADKVGGATYDSVGFTAEYGFGRLNALAALQQSNLQFRQIRVSSNQANLASGGSLNFGATNLLQPTDQTVRISNLGTAALTLGTITLGSGPFSLVSLPSKKILGPGESTSVVVRFTPTVVGPSNGSLSIASNDPATAQFNLVLTGRAVIPSINGRLYEDWNGNGVRDSNDPAWCNDFLYLDLDGNGEWNNGGEPSAFCSRVDGTFAFNDLAPGTYTLRLVNANGFERSTSPAAQFYTVTLDSPTAIVGNRDFGITMLNAIYGQAFSDRNHDGIHQANEPGVAGQQAYLDMDKSGALERTSYASTDTPKTIVDGADVSSTLTVSGFAGTMYDVDITVTLLHPEINDLTLYLKAPDSISYGQYRLFDRSLYGTNMVDTIFDNDAPQLLSEGQAPLSGRFRPVYGDMFDLNFNGNSPNGVWTLKIADANGASRLNGTLVSWSISVSGDYVAGSEQLGNLAFYAVPPGDYSVHAIDLPGWRRTTPASGVYQITMPVGGTVYNRDIGLVGARQMYVPIARRK